MHIQCSVCGIIARQNLEFCQTVEHKGGNARHPINEMALLCEKQSVHWNRKVLIPSCCDPVSRQYYKTTVQVYTTLRESFCQPTSSSIYHLAPTCKGTKVQSRARNRDLNRSQSAVRNIAHTGVLWPDRGH